MDIDNNYLETTVSELTKKTRSKMGFLVLINQEDRAEVVACIQSKSPGDMHEKLAKAFENMADEIRSGGGIPIGRDGEEA